MVEEKAKEKKKENNPEFVLTAATMNAIADIVKSQKRTEDLVRATMASQSTLATLNQIAQNSLAIQRFMAPTMSILASHLNEKKAMENLHQQMQSIACYEKTLSSPSIGLIKPEMAIIATNQQKIDERLDRIEKLVKRVIQLLGETELSEEQKKQLEKLMKEINEETDKAYS